MKSITFFFILLGATVLVFGQEAKREALGREVDEYVATVGRAAAQFLDKNLGATERLKAIEPYAVIYDEKQVAQFREVVLDEKEAAEIRAMALSKIFALAAQDEALQRLELQWLGDTQAPKVLREQALRLEENLFFLKGEVPEVFQKLLNDPDPQFRLVAFGQLVAHGDARAQQLLIAGLDEPAKELLPPRSALAVLSMAAKKEYLPAVYNLLQRTQDEATKVDAIRLLGGYKEAREKLIALSRDRNEKQEIREAALGALFAGDRDNLVQYVLPILSDSSAPVGLRVIAIQMATDVRQAMSFRAKAQKADELDNLIKNIAQDKSAKDPALDTVASRYLQAVRPNF